MSLEGKCPKCQRLFTKVAKTHTCAYCGFRFDVSFVLNKPVEGVNIISDPIDPIQKTISFKIAIPLMFVGRIVFFTRIEPNYTERWKYLRIKHTPLCEKEYNMFISTDASSWEAFRPKEYFEYKLSTLPQQEELRLNSEELCQKRVIEIFGHIPPGYIDTLNETLNELKLEEVS